MGDYRPSGAGGAAAAAARAKAKREAQREGQGAALKDKPPSFDDTSLAKQRRRRGAKTAKERWNAGEFKSKSEYLAALAKEEGRME